MLTKGDMEEDSNGGARRDGAHVGQAAAKDRALRRNIVVAFCVNGDEKD